MESVGIVCEFNPLHNGHIYYIKKVKEMFPGRTIILVLNGYFLQRGEVSVLSKENKTLLSLIYGIDLVVELPFIFGTQSADIFADAAIKILNFLGCTDFVFGSESNEINTIESIADTMANPEYNIKVKEYLSEGVNYPTALAKALNVEEFAFAPNDLLGISYIKAIKKNKFKMTAHTIKRTSDYHDINSTSSIVSASNIRHKLASHEDISNYTTRKVIRLIENISLNDLFPYIKYKILIDNDLGKYLTVDEGIENRLKECIMHANTIQELIEETKTKRYTYNKLSRMMLHILLSVPKDINKLASIEYVKILGFNKKGRDYLHNLKEDEMEISLIPMPNSLVYKYEILASSIYSLISNNDTLRFDKSNKPIFFE